MTIEEHSGDGSTTDTSSRYARRRTPFGGHVAAYVSQLQQRYRRAEPAAAAILAQLRASVGRTPGSDYAVLEATLVPDGYLDDKARRRDDPADADYAKHAAVTLFAVHQQSIRDIPMHVDGRALGGAVADLARKANNVEAVRRRFVALGTATTYDETLFHLRTTIRQLRDERIQLDYGLLADDLAALRSPRGRDLVRSSWGRDFYRTLTRIDATVPAATDPE